MHKRIHRRCLWFTIFCIWDMKILEATSATRLSWQWCAFHGHKIHSNERWDHNFKIEKSIHEKAIHVADVKIPSKILGANNCKSKTFLKCDKEQCSMWKVWYRFVLETWGDEFSQKNTHSAAPQYTNGQRSTKKLHFSLKHYRMHHAHERSLVPFSAAFTIHFQVQIQHNIFLYFRILHISVLHNSSNAAI